MASCSLPNTSISLLDASSFMSLSNDVSSTSAYVINQAFHSKRFSFVSLPEHGHLVWRTTLFVSRILMTLSSRKFLRPRVTMSPNLINDSMQCHGCNRVRKVHGQCTCHGLHFYFITIGFPPVHQSHQWLELGRGQRFAIVYSCSGAIAHIRTS